MIDDRVREKPKPFSKTLISDLDDTFLLKLNTEPKEEKSLIRSF